MVEILSRPRRRDRGVKARRYAVLGVPHYWIVDPGARCVECYRAGSTGYDLVARGEGDDSIAHPDWDGLGIDLAPLWS